MTKIKNTPPLKESTIEKKVCAYATSKGWLNFKFQSPTNRGVPDRIFMKNNITFFIEFKTLGKKPSAIQEVIHKKIREQGRVCVYTVDNVDKGKDIIDLFEAVV